jgi:hypothetical protein
MLLFLMGVDLPTLVLFLVILFGLGLFIFWLTRKLFRRILKHTSEQKIKLLSRISAFILSPVILVGFQALFIYMLMQDVRVESDEKIADSHYQIMEQDLREDLKPGMSKTDVVELLGETDTVRSTLIYDLSLPQAKEKYILEITFDREGLKDFKRQR